MLALPVAGFFDGMLPGLLADGTRDVLLLGGLTMLLTGSLTLWSVRRSLMALTQADRPEVGEAAEAFRKYRKAVTGLGETAEIERVDGGPPK